MKNYQEREFSCTSVRPTNRQESRFARIAPGGCGIGICRMNGDAHDCMDAGGTTPWMGEVESRLEQRSRATQGAVAEGGTS